MGRRELAEVLLPPFEMALRFGGARSVMNSYSEIDGVPVAADRSLLTGLLRDEWGFTGTVVADYFSIRFLQSLHRVAAGPAEAAGQALSAGIDVELPTVDTYGEPLIGAVRAGAVDEALVDRALLRVLTQKAELGLLDDDWRALPEGAATLRLDDEESQAVSLRLAREAIVLLRNDDAILPLRPGASVALVGPTAGDPLTMLGCYAFPVHVGSHHPGRPLGIRIPSLREAFEGLPVSLTYEPGCEVRGDDRSGIPAAVAAAEAADVCVLAVGDRAGMFGRGTSGEGCDATDLRLPGVQPELVRAVLATGTPVVLTVVSGRPYAMGPETDAAAAIVQAFLPGQLGAVAIAEVLTGAVNPSGRLPVSVPRDSGGLPGTYLTPPLGQRSGVSSVDPTPAFPFGHGLGYASFAWDDAGPLAPGEWPVDGETTVGVRIRNTGSRAGAEVVQLYLHDPVAQTTRPVVRLIGFARVVLDPGEAARVTFEVPADLAALVGVDGRRVVEPGDVELRLGRSSRETVAVVPLRLVGEEREAGHGRQLRPRTRIEREPAR
jgi:beta-glucosidase